MILGPSPFCSENPRESDALVFMKNKTTPGFKRALRGRDSGLAARLLWAWWVFVGHGEEKCRGLECYSMGAKVQAHCLPRAPRSTSTRSKLLLIGCRKLFDGHPKLLVGRSKSSLDTVYGLTSTWAEHSVGFLECLVRGM